MSSLQTNLVSIGVDVGSVNGAISVVSEEGEILLLTKVPTYQTEIKTRRNKSKLNKETGKYEADFRKKNWVDFRRLRELLEPFESYKKLYTIEKITARSNEGESISFSNGNSLGIFQGLYVYLNPIDYFEPLPKVWKSEIGLSSVKDDSIKLAEQIYQVRLKDYLKKGKVDDLAESLLLAFYGLKKYYEDERE